MTAITRGRSLSRSFQATITSAGPHKARPQNSSEPPAILGTTCPRQAPRKTRCPALPANSAAKERGEVQADGGRRPTPTFRGAENKLDRPAACFRQGAFSGKDIP